MLDGILFFSCRKICNFDRFHTEFGPIAFSEVGYQSLSSMNAVRRCKRRMSREEHGNGGALKAYQGVALLASDKPPPAQQS